VYRVENGELVVVLYLSSVKTFWLVLGAIIGIAIVAVIITLAVFIVNYIKKIGNPLYYFEFHKNGKDTGRRRAVICRRKKRAGEFESGTPIRDVIDYMKISDQCEENVFKSDYPKIVQKSGIWYIEYNKEEMFNEVEEEPKKKATVTFDYLNPTGGELQTNNDEGKSKFIMPEDKQITNGLELENIFENDSLNKLVIFVSI